jgi:hypothetical protein
LSRAYPFRPNHIECAARILLDEQSAYQPSMCSTSSTGLRSDGEKLLPV